MADAERPTKRAKLLSDEESDSDPDIKLEGQDGKPHTNGLKINSEYARRFEHKKKREEQHRLEEKYGKTSSQERPREDARNEEEEDEEDSESDESEDDDAELATKDLDDEISATLQAIKSKDPRVYDQSIKFYKDFDTEAEAANGPEKKEKPMHLHEYHRRNLIDGYTGEDEQMEDAPQTYQQEQDEMRDALVGEMHASANGTSKENDGEEDEFLVAKSRPKHQYVPAKQPTAKITDTDVAAADKDPETYLSNFMAARAWLPTSESRWQAFESEDSEDDERADEFEAAYNLRFEDPEASNEKLKSFSRDVGKYSVRRDEKGGARKRARDREREKKDDAKRERKEEMARLRKLKIEEAEEKVKKIKDVAGMRGKEIDLDEWKNIIEGDFDDNRWEAEMTRRFGENYYAQDDMYDQEDGEGGGKRKLKKPKWNDDIEIKDLVPDFEDDDDQKPAFTLSSDDEDEQDGDGGVRLNPDENGDREASLQSSKKHKTKKDRAKGKAEAKRTARRERRQIETLVDSTLPISNPDLSATTSKGPPVGFRYRDTSPTNFGLTSRDILFADDSQLNQYAGLKKMATWRDQDRKQKDRKKFSKKARLRQWRKETFGSAEMPEGGFERVVGKDGGDPGPATGVNAEVVVGGGGEGKKRKRSKKWKAAG